MTRALTPAITGQNRNHDHQREQEPESHAGVNLPGMM